MAVAASSPSAGFRTSQTCVTALERALPEVKSVSLCVEASKKRSEGMRYYGGRHQLSTVVFKVHIRQVRTLTAQMQELSREACHRGVLTMQSTLDPAAAELSYEQCAEQGWAEHRQHAGPARQWEACAGVAVIRDNWADIKKHAVMCRLWSQTVS